MLSPFALRRLAIEPVAAEACELHGHGPAKLSRLGDPSVPYRGRHGRSERSFSTRCSSSPAGTDSLRITMNIYCASIPHGILIARRLPERSASSSGSRTPSTSARPADVDTFYGLGQRVFAAHVQRSELDRQRLHRTPRRRTQRFRSRHLSTE